ncbi:hypothetical protein HNY73_010893 [Argiope bruennichi]|uniref:Uncharacterized protein n=1 Tax=Argiope bruennichi TaxID=94029 RepID=A0A8T0F7E4_ARGBR|nr:hypothetical protein HNY73_010893 [Argiope bruennichi]
MGIGWGSRRAVPGGQEGARGATEQAGDPVRAAGGVCTGGSARKTLQFTFGRLRWMKRNLQNDTIQERFFFKFGRWTVVEESKLQGSNSQNLSEIPIFEVESSEDEDIDGLDAKNSMNVKCVNDNGIM